MSADSFSWLHLTDFHYGLDGQDCLWPNLREPFLKSLDELHECCGPWDAVLFTGENGLPLRWWETNLLRDDIWEVDADGRWWIVPGKV